MNIRELIEDMESDIKYAADKGVTGIPLKNIKAWLEKIKGNVKDQTEPDSSKNQRDLAFYAAKHTSRIEYFAIPTDKHLMRYCSNWIFARLILFTINISLLTICLSIG